MTYIASIVGLMVVGAMTASMIDITTPLSFTAGQTTMKAQEFIDKILLAAAAAFHPWDVQVDPKESILTDLLEPSFGMAASARPARRGISPMHEDYE
ncbi:PTS system mannose/fructose/sorbose family transporter subunit IID [Klebsiella pneumoniae]|uniref:PTS system mannose/fructose/sorbose family transporter subunit IID n=1 Tax=Klebsiella pneumoniae TaxID=573 RepID=UPI00388ED6C6